MATATTAIGALTAPGARNRPRTRRKSGFAVLECLFGSGEVERHPAVRAKLERYRKSVLDPFYGTQNACKDSSDRLTAAKLDEYLYAVREIETRIQKTEPDNAQIIPNLDKPAPSIPENDSDHTRMMFDLMTVASQTDPTRVVTFLTAIEQSNRAYREIGIADSHHGLTHHGGNKEKIEKCININRCQLEQFAYFMGKLKATQDGDGTLFDRVMVTYGSGLSRDHEHDKLIDGHHGSRQRSLYLRQAREVYERNPLANLHVAMMNQMGVPAEQFAGSNGKLEYLSSL